MCAVPWSCRKHYCKICLKGLRLFAVAAHANKGLLLQLLGRADIVKEFIRRGETEGLVEITLASGEDRPITVSRRIRTDENTGGLSDWKLNGETQPLSQS